MFHDHPFDSLLNQAEAQLSCPICHRRFQRAELKLRGMLERHGIVQATCNQNHNPAVVMYMADQPAGSASESVERLMTADDVLALRQSLKTFDGNFAQLFHPRTPAPNPEPEA